MSVVNVISGPVESGEPSRHWEPALTQKEAFKLGIARRDYDRAAGFAELAVREHQALGAPRHLWEPTPAQNDSLAAPFITDGEDELASRLAKEADPVLDRSQDLLENVTANLDEISEETRPLAGSETGSSYSVTGAVARVRELDAKIRQDEAAGKHHHRRASVLLVRLAAGTPWVEATGFLAFVTYYINVNLFAPLKYWLPLSFASSIVAVIIIGQTWLVRHAATSHNQAREARADGNRSSAEQEFAQRNKYLGLTAVTAVAITSAMIARGIIALGGASFVTTALMAFLATVTGLLLPTLGFLGKALDGSAVSRERDSLMSALDDDLDAYQETIGSSRRDLASVTETGETLKEKTFPDICITTQEAVDAVYGLYGNIRLLIGALSADPPGKTIRTTSQDAQGTVHGFLQTSIPGARAVSLDPLLDRWNRLEDIGNRQVKLLQKIDDLPPHPWGHSRTS